MRIGLLIYGTLNTVSGGYLYDRQLVQQLRVAGHEVDVVSLPWLGYGRSLLQNFSPALFNQLKNTPFDLLLQDELNHPSLAWLNGRLRRHVSYPIIAIVHHLRQSEQHPVLWQPLYRYVESRYLRSVDGFVFNSQTTRRVVHKLVGSQRPFIVAPPAGNRFHSPMTPEQIEQRAYKQPLRLIFVGNVTPRKGLHTLIEAVKQLPPDGWTLDVVGDTAVAPAYAQKWLHDKSVDIKMRVTIHGKVSDNKLAALFTQAHALVVPSQYEGFGIVYLEAMGFGCPAIGTTAGAAGEIIDNGRNGFLIDVGETAVLAHHLNTLMTNRALLTKLSISAYKTSRQHPDWASSMKRVVQFLENVQAHWVNPVAS